MVGATGRIDDVAQQYRVVRLLQAHLVGDDVLAGFAVGEVADHDEARWLAAAHARMRGLFADDLTVQFHDVGERAIEGQAGKGGGIANIVLILLLRDRGLGDWGGEIHRCNLDLGGDGLEAFGCVLDREATRCLVGHPDDAHLIRGLKRPLGARLQVRLR